MATSENPRKSERIFSLIRRKKTPSESAATKADPASAQAIQGWPCHNRVVVGDYGDRQRTEERYIEAASLLEDALKTRRERGDSELFDFPELIGEPGGFNDAKFRDKINLALESRKDTVKDQTNWSKCKNTVQCIFQALSPFAKNFLIIAKDGQSVF